MNGQLRGMSVLAVIVMAGCMAPGASENREAHAPLETSTVEPGEVLEESQEIEIPVADRLHLRGCTSAGFYVEAPNQLFPHAPPEGWPGAIGFVPRIVATVAHCEEAEIDDELYLSPFEMCLFTHTNITKKDDAWQNARYTVLWDFLGLVVSHADQLKPRLPQLSPEAGEVELHLQESEGHLKVEAKCTWQGAEVALAGVLPSTGPGDDPGLPGVARIVTEPAQPHWWSLNFLQTFYEQIPENPLVRLVVPGVGEILHSGATPFAHWPVQNDRGIPVAALDAAIDGEFRWYRNGTGLE